MKESLIETRLTKKCRAEGWRVYKFVSPGTAGVPDRLILLPGGRAVFAELKAPGKKPRPLQLLRQEQIAALGFTVEPAIDSYAAVDDFIERMGRETK